MKRTRDYRRHVRHRKVMKARRILKYVWNSHCDTEEEFLSHHANRLADNIAECSCWMCGNVRRTGKGRAKLTRQEITKID